MGKNRTKVAVGLSGGVDSAVAAALLQQQGYDVTGFYLQCWDFDRPGCGGDVDRNDAIHIATTLGIKFKHLEFIDQYKKRVIDLFYAEYKAGRTPNPDIICNTEIKFGIFLNWAIDNGFDFVATGHYARLKKAQGCTQLLKGADAGKDQSYFLYGLNQNQLEHTLFPIGDMYKEDIRQKARDLGLRVFNKPDSVGICFIGEVDIKKFLQERLPLERGDVITQDGRVIGHHDGVWFYTIGQRHGFEITEYMGIPLYVVGKKVEENKLIVGPVKDVLRKSFYVDNLHWICDSPEFPLSADVRIRNLGQFYPSEIIQQNQNLLRVNSSEKLFGVAPGQSAVFYSGDVVLGGGTIAG